MSRKEKEEIRKLLEEAKASRDRSEKLISDSKRLFFL
tara:strand:- start:400 stop:510 length:111 start_codon:yes stop_codon:yes gene_type:complete